MSADEFRTPSMDQQVDAFMALVQELCEGEDTLEEQEAQKAILEVGLEQLWKRIIGPDPEDALQFAVQLAQRALWTVHADVVHVLQMRGASEMARIRKEIGFLLVEEG